MRRAAVSAASALTLLLAVTGGAYAGGGGGGGGGDKGKSGEAPGEVKQEQAPAQPTQSKEKSEHKSQSSEHKSQSSEHKSQSSAHKESKSTKSTSATTEQAKPAKVTLCHATGSATNPYVKITISENAVAAHRAHQGGRDIIPAPSAGCPAGRQAQEHTTTTTAGKVKVKEEKAKEGKVTICHATGSATNPYVVITISENAVAAHRAHQGGRDIIPAPAGGCPTGQQGQQTTTTTTTTEKVKEGKVTICHATGSATNPYVVITISENALDAHRAHQGGRDIIPAPAGGCPTAQQAQQTTTTTTVQQQVASQQQQQQETQQQAAAGAGAGPAGGVAGASKTIAKGKAAPAAQQKQAKPRAGVAGAQRVATPLQTTKQQGGALPFTGIALAVFAVIALGLIAAGLMLRRGGFRSRA